MSIMATAMFQGGAGLGLRVVSTAQRVTCVARPKSARIVPRPAKKEVQLNSLAPGAPSSLPGSPRREPVNRQLIR